MEEKAVEVVDLATTKGSISSLSRVHNQAEANLSPVLSEAATY